MKDIKEEVLINYFPEYLDLKMIKYLEKRYKAEEKLSTLRFKKKNIDEAAKIRLRKAHVNVGDKIDMVSPTAMFWRKNDSNRKALVHEVRTSVKKLVKSIVNKDVWKNRRTDLRTQKVKPQNFVRIFEKYQRKLKKSPSVQKKRENSIRSRVSSLRGMSPKKSKKFSGAESDYDSVFMDDIDLVMTPSSKRLEIMKTLEFLEEITEVEMDRLVDLYHKKHFSVMNIVNLYKISLLLFGNHEANDFILDFLKIKNVRGFFDFLNRGFRIRFWGITMQMRLSQI